MGEKVYKTMKSVGIVNLVMGIVLISIGVAVGTVMLVSGGRLIKNKSEVLF
ncbi:hypothetical protein [Anaeromicropila populeti]|uniref:Uncharacterized protein n=1 Tax=Anaeromicropila populeti TaxID=37658 RepID=A0A1I6JCZ1_9FIRM|nr:hypothetical protein [Anaeromicropila populeti]SFR76895.1 hypothetical protein SAMN05661086_01581 [Anaeromicropila populeti]